MKAVATHNAAWLRKVAIEIVRQIKPAIAGTALKIRPEKKISTTETDTKGWAAVIGSLGKGQPNLEVWLDRFTGHTVRRLYVCFLGRDEKQVRALRGGTSKKHLPVLEITDADIVEGKFTTLKRSLSEKEFNTPIFEHYNTSRNHFYGLYDGTPDSSFQVSPKFVALALGFIQDVVSSLPGTAAADIDARVYARCENRKLVKAHLARERSGFLAAACKVRDDYSCQICNFHFAERYGTLLGAAFAEAHHIVPLVTQGDVVDTQLKDLLTVCSNCHRMLHRMDGKKGDIAKLKALILKNSL